MEDGGPSVTARRVAAHRLGFDRAAADFGDPAADQALATDVAAGHVAPANRMHDYLAARTACFDRTVVAAIDRGVRQVVVGAAGYDGRAFRYAKPGARWFEVDHPATQRDKLARLGLDASHVRFIEADCTRPARPSCPATRWSCTAAATRTAARQEDQPQAPVGRAVAGMTPSGRPAALDMDPTFPLSSPGS